MFSTKPNIQILTSLLLKSGITQVVLCPGSRNAALVHTFHAAGMKCYDITDERSAGFFAIGLIEANGGAPVAVCVTSGSAVLNLAPAVSEAYYRNFPLLLITADRPQQWIGQMDGQTLPQPGAFGSMAAKCVSLPEPSDDESRWYCNRLVNEALIALHRQSRPVHINVPVTEPFFDFSAPQLLDERLVAYTSAADVPPSFTDDMLDEMGHCDNIVLLIGQMLPEEMARIAPSLISLHEKGCTLLAETLSNIHTIPSLHGRYIGDFQAYINTPFTPEGRFLLITIGGHIVSKPLKKHFRTNPPRHHWHVTPHGELSDLFMSLTRIVATTAECFLNALTIKGDIHPEMVKCNATLQTTTPPNDQTTKQPNDQTTGVGELLMQIAFPDYRCSVIAEGGEEYILQVANSSMVRTVQRLFSSANPIHCNRGINGIEGSVSAAVGYWVGSALPTMLLIGDLSFFYDQNGLWNKYVQHPSSAPLRIFILNNGCGKIFYNLPDLSSPYLDQSIAASHTTTAQGIALQCGAQYTAVNTPELLAQALPSFLDTTPDVRILEVKSEG